MDATLTRMTLPGRPLRPAPAARQRTRTPVVRALLFGRENGLLAQVVQAFQLGTADVAWNPFVLHGPTGTGKSHLVRGLALQRTQTDAAASVLYQSAADFAVEYASAITQQSLPEFRKTWDTLDLWVLEDLEYLADKHQTQEEVTRLIDLSVAHGTQVIVTARQLPQLLDGLQWPLRSRLLGGLTLPLVHPSEATRRAMLDDLALELGIGLPPGAAQILAENLRTAYELAGALQYLEAAALQAARSMTTDDATRYINELNLPSAPQLRKIASETARLCELKVADLRGESRRQGIVEARGIAMHLARELTNRSLQQIGAYFGGRDHSTVLHACRKTSERIATDPAAAQVVAHLRRKLVGL